MTREHLIETSNEAAAVAWERAILADGGDRGAQLDELAKTIAAGLNGVRIATLALEQAMHDATAPPAVEVQPINAELPKRWVEYELLGHRSGVALAWEGEYAGAHGLWLQKLLRDVDATPGVGEANPVLRLDEPHFYARAALYSVRPIDGGDAAAELWRNQHGYGEEIPF